MDRRKIEESAKAVGIESEIGRKSVDELREGRCGGKR